ncbi:MAG: hypothetical protein CM15mP77_0040 [Synechococcus sp.]|nr:MAG: hypothetical protein CM15mP77_0040 [Synechococcus sp.]
MNPQRKRFLRAEYEESKQEGCTSQAESFESGTSIVIALFKIQKSKFLLF